MDQIFDRLERLFKSWTAPDTDESLGTRHSSSGNPDLDAAMSELDDFLDKDRAAAEQRTREREAQERARAARPSQPARPSGPPAVVVGAYKTLGLAVGAPMTEVKAAYKKLLLRHHPDRNSGNQADQKKATDISARINEAYQVIETWTSTGTVNS